MFGQRSNHQVFENLSQAWKLRCGGPVDEVEYEEDLRMLLKEVQPGGSGSDTTKPVGGSQGSLEPVAAPPCPASKGDKEKDSALPRYASASGY